MPYDPNEVFDVIAQYIVDNTERIITPADMRLVLAQMVADARQGGGTFAADFVANPAYGKYGVGQNVPAAGKTGPELTLDAYSAEIFPSYAAPSASLLSDQAGPLEVGSTFDPTLEPGFIQRDAGPLVSYLLARGNVTLAQDDAAPIEYPQLETDFVLPFGTTTYTATFSYGQGPQKLGNAGNPAPGRIAAGSKSATFSVDTAYKVFFGPAAATPATSAAARLLPSRLASVPGSFVLNTGTALRHFVLVLPPGKSLVSIVDLDVLSKDVTAEYLATPLMVLDAAGEQTRNSSGQFSPSTLLVKEQAVAYSTNHRHQITLS